jgi:hypothetical protein
LLAFGFGEVPKRNVGQGFAEFRHRVAAVGVEQPLVAVVHHVD